MAEFGKSLRCKDNFYVENGKTVYFNRKELGELKSNLESAVSETTGYGAWKCQWKDKNGNQSKITATSSGVTLDNGVGGELNLTYGEARDLVRQIEDRVWKEETIEKKLGEMSR